MSKELHKLQVDGKDIEEGAVLNKWFEKPEYKDVLEYVKSVGCYYFFYTIPFDFLGLPKPA